MGKDKIKIQKPKKRQTWKISPVTRIKGSNKVYKRKGKTKYDPEKEMECEVEVSRGNYRYCPRCSAELVEKRIDHRKRKSCPVCGFVFYKNPVPAAGVIITKDDKILLVKRRYDPFKGDWSIPAGFMEYEESPEECAIREIKEELNLDIKIKKLFNVYSGSDDPRTNAVLIVYLGEVIGGNLKPGDDAEEARFFGNEKIPPNIAFQAHRKLIRDYFDLIKVKT
jgi:8-oxo-dGTP diphosphatase